MRGVLPAVVVLAASGVLAWFLIADAPEAVRTTTTPPPPTQAELMLRQMDRLEAQLVAGEAWREELYADKKRVSGYERPPAAYQRKYTPDIRAALKRLQSEPSQAVKVDAAAEFRAIASHLSRVLEQSRKTALLMGTTAANDLPPDRLVLLLLQFAEFLAPATSPAPK